MKAGEYVVLIFVAVMFAAFISIYIYVQIRRFRRYRQQQKHFGDQ